LRSLDLSAGYTWLDTSILALDGSTLVSSPFEVGQPLLRRPRSSASYDITWRHRRLTLNTNAFIRGATLDLEPNFAASTFRNPGYVLANAGFSYQLPRGLEIHGKLNNFTNEKYEDVFGFPSLRLNFLAGIRYQLPSK
jgi:outer membrane receptor protein involved in Fe transport